MKILRLCTLAFLFFTSLRADETATPAQAVQRFREMLKTVDRIVLVRILDEPNPEDKPVQPLPEIKGTNVITSLGEGFALEKFDAECLCLTSPEIHFYKGTDYRFSMTLHHGIRLRCKDGPWGGDAVMTDASAAHFRDWFAQQGYEGFVQLQKNVEEWKQKQIEREIPFLALFPESVRSLFSREDNNDFNHDKKIAQLKAAIPDAQTLVQICWRALGELQAWSSQTRRPHEQLLMATLATIDEKSLCSALTSLKENDPLPWLGAYQQSISKRHKQNAIAKIVHDDWFARLAEKSFSNGNTEERIYVIWALRERPTKASIRLLFKIAQANDLPEDLRNRNSDYCVPMRIHALFELACLKISEAKPFIIEALSKTPDRKTKLSLEVALAQLDDSTPLTIEHLNCKVFGVARNAWQTMSAATDFHPTIDFLVSAANSECYEARRGAEALLRKRGLRTLSEHERVAEALNEPRLQNASSIPALSQIIKERESNRTKNTSDLESRVLASLHHRRARLLLQEGKFEEAKSDLEAAPFTPEAWADKAFILQTLGRLHESIYAQNMGFDDTKIGRAADEFAERRAFLSFAQGWFEDAAADFAAAIRINFRAGDTRPLFRHLALMLAGKPDQQGLAEWQTVFTTNDDTLFWPDTGMRMLQGKQTEDEVLRRIKESRNQDSDDLCEAHFVISVLRRIKGDTAGEREHLLAALATKRYMSQAYSLAIIRLRELETLATASPEKK